MSLNYITELYEGYIYIITNKIDSKRYIGQTLKTIKERFAGHCSNKPHTYIDKAIHKHGSDNFSVEQLERVVGKNREDVKETLDYLEKMYIVQYNTLFPNGYNIDTGGGIDTYHGINIDVYDLNGEIIKKFDTIKECAGYYYIAPDTIRKICNGTIPRIQRLDLVFRYAGDPFDKYDINLPHKMIYKWTSDGELVGIYNSSTEAADSVKANYPKAVRTAIMDYITNHRNGLIYGYYWSLENSFKFNKKDYYVHNPKSRSVDQYDINGNYINTYKSAYEALRVLGALNSSSSTIYRVCKGNAVTAYGYVWRYSGDAFDKYKTKGIHGGPKHPRRVNQYSLNNDFIKSYDSVSNAIKSFDKNNKCLYIYQCLKRNNKAYGYLWFYADDPNQPDKTKIISEDNDVDNTVLVMSA